jgi:hypothetical protein
MRTGERWAAPIAEASAAVRAPRVRLATGDEAGGTTLAAELAAAETRLASLRRERHLARSRAAREQGQDRRAWQQRLADHA